MSISNFALLEDELTKEIVSLLNPLHLELYSLEIKQSKPLLIRVYIINPASNSATLEECIEVDKTITPFIDGHTKIPDNSILEVSSPGIYRALKVKRHYELALGKKIKVKLTGPLMQFIKKSNSDKDDLNFPQAIKTGNVFKGILHSVNEEGIHFQDVQGLMFFIPFNHIKNSELEQEIKW